MGPERKKAARATFIVALRRKQNYREEAGIPACKEMDKRAG